MMTILETRELRKIYGSGNTEVRALDGVNLSVEKGEFVAVVGTSGSGKSTLLHMLGGLDRPTSGTVTVDGRELSALKDEALTIFRRRKIGFVFQNYNLVPVPQPQGGVRDHATRAGSPAQVEHHVHLYFRLQPRLFRLSERYEPFRALL